MIPTLRRSLQLLARYHHRAGKAANAPRCRTDPAGRRKARFGAALPATKELEDGPPLENWALLVGRTDMQRLDGLPLLKTREPKLLQTGKRLLCRGRDRPLGPGMVDGSGTMIIIH
jgi:hypothetical protein